MNYSFSHELRPTVKPGTPPPVVHTTPAVRSRDILFELRQLKERGQTADGIADLEERYIYRESAFGLRTLGELLLHARRQAHIQDRLNGDREALHSGRLSHEELIETGHHYETLRHAACEYNHLLRGFIEAHRDEVDRDDLTRWLTSASMGRERWAEGEVTGSMSEIALHAALMGMPELRDLRYATLEEDLHGSDFVAQWQGQLVTVDAKTGHYPPVTERMRGHRHLEVSVPREAVHGFRLTRQGLDMLRREVRQGLHASVGVGVHGAHAPYQSR
jgi:hypothetical protein